MPTANYVCTICSQTFTRRWRGNTHNIKLHYGNATIVRFIDYVIGRLDGQYLPSDPSLYRRVKGVLSHENYNARFDQMTIQHRIDWSNTMTGEPSGKADTTSDLIQNNSYTLPMASSRLEEAKRILMSFQTPGTRPSVIVEKTLADLSFRIIERRGDDSFLEAPIGELRKKRNQSDAVKALCSLGRNPVPTTDAEYSTQEPERTLIPSAYNLPPSALDVIKQIREVLSPFYPSAYVEKKINELLDHYYQTGDTSIFSKTLVSYLNDPHLGQSR